jgi:hypothetical protein
MSKYGFYPFFTPYDAPRGKRVYVSGPMTGYENNNHEAFGDASMVLRDMGYAVCNPCETTDILGDDGTLKHADFLRFDFERVLEADFLVALGGWERSMGAISEILMAVRMGVKVWSWETFENYDRIRYEDVAQAISDIHMGAVQPTTVGAAS